MKLLNVLSLCALLVAPRIDALDTPTQSPAPHRFTFSFPFADTDAMKPRGASSIGAPVTLDTQVSAQWQALQAPTLHAQERDRRAILAMAGEYRVSFDFLEVVQFDATAPKDRPYQNWATEKVYVVEDRPDFVSLQHILVMHLLDDAGKPQAPIVTKHWRQDWQFEPAHLDEYQGPIRWQRRALSAAMSKGRWSQTAYQVDDSPRYAAIGRWRHNSSFSTWQSAKTLRPLPRREYSFRSDYQLLTARNRHTILPTGWVQEENNLKTRMLDAESKSDTPRWVAREYGIARYERIVGTDFTAGDVYWQQSGVIWAQVRAYWSELFAVGTPLCLHSAPDQKQLYVPLFELAADSKKLQRLSAEKLRRSARKTIDSYLAAGRCSSGTML